MERGMTAAALAPASSRASTSEGRFGANAQSVAVITQAKQAHAMTRYLPKRSPIGPKKSCDKPYAMENAVMTAEASPRETANWAARRGRSASVRRSEIALEKTAYDIATIAIEGSGAGWLSMASDAGTEKPARRAGKTRTLP